MIVWFFSFFVIVAAATKKQEDLSAILPRIIKEKDLVAPLAFMNLTSNYSAVLVDIMSHTISREMSGTICCSPLFSTLLIEVNGRSSSPNLMLPHRSYVLSRQNCNTTPQVFRE